MAWTAMLTPAFWCAIAILRLQPVAFKPTTVHLLARELLLEVEADDFSVGAATLAKNITTVGLGLEQIPLATLLDVGQNALIELVGSARPAALSIGSQPV
jgi:hypothetical protein